MISKDIVTTLKRRVAETLSGVESGKILVTVSGGADSVALLLLMTESGREIEAANCNFRLRGEESERDSRFVADLCKRFGIKLHAISFDTEHYCMEHTLSLEMGCRKLRHDWWNRLCKEEGFVRIATGHNASDNAETLLLNLMRGSGCGGLKGMLPDDGRIIRPLLATSRSEITQFLLDRGQDFVTDSTNLQSDYRRNYLRNQIMPQLRQKWEGADRALGRSLEILRKEHKILSHFIAKSLGDNPLYLPYPAISEFPEPSTLIFHFIKRYGGSADIAEEAARSFKLMQRGTPISGKKWRLTCENVIPGYELTAGREAFEITGTAIRETHLEWEEVSMSDEIWRKIRQSPLSEVWLPQGEDAYTLAPLRNGDRIRPLGMHGSSLCSRIVKGSHLSASQKRDLTALRRKSDNEIIWIPGLKRSRFDLISRGMEKVYHAYEVK